MLRKNLLLLCAAFLCGCSLLVYTPVIATAVLGLDKTDLSDHVEYKRFVNHPFHLVSPEGKPWQLKKFDGGRYYIEQPTEYSKKREVCSLESGSAVIEEIFNDSNNGGKYYAATVRCNGQDFSAPLNRWSENIKISIEFLDENT